MSAPVRPPASRAGDPRTAPPPGPALRVALVGPGRAGSAVAAALAAAGHHIIAVAGRTPGTAARLAHDLTAGTAADPAPPAARVVADPRAAAEGADLVVVAVPDAAVADVVAALAPAVGPGRVVAHLSGAYGLGVLAPALDRGAGALALHPAMTFVGDPGDAARLAAGVTFGATASPGAGAVARRLVADLGGRLEWIAEADRVRYHAALAHGANHLVTLVADAAELAGRAGVADPAALLAPLLRAALDNVLARGAAALTGPVARGDAATVRAHLADLDRTAPGIAAPYRALARRAADRAAHPPATTAALHAALADPPATPTDPAGGAR
ncbi:hypothetical protein GCM10010123_29360 [Pilimelia anulata]|uniref:DUF2520 domain-containing protein n=1 Tax=Pilimelia anulata TaxID=53371 RepID=A0A8J3FBT5_9ACTN|nr:Rossmann-like and DUF2520 domain-containing protein [Pilimelia anulata]GGJ97463.1 hypothetical protein GCM10010123_29360 [Pilimelia anulata]